MKFGVYQASRIGGRKYNQDRVAYAYTGEVLLLVLADGMGGHLHGELAAQITIQTFMDAFERTAQPRVPDPERFLCDVMLDAHKAIIKHAREQQLGGNPGTTCVAALVQDGQVSWAHAGDSRFYLLRKGATVAVTHDHSVVQQWSDWGIISPEEMKTHPDRNKITDCLGGIEGMFFAEPAPAVALHPNDVLLLCSDGLWSPLVDDEIAAAFQSTPLQGTLEKLMDTALVRSGSYADNTTAVVARWDAFEQEHPAAAPVCVVLDVGEDEALTELLGRTLASTKGLA